MTFSYITFITKFNCTFKKLTLLIQRYLINKLIIIIIINKLIIIIIIIIMIIVIIIMSADKSPSIFSRQMEGIVYILIPYCTG